MYNKGFDDPAIPADMAGAERSAASNAGVGGDDPFWRGWSPASTKCQLFYSIYGYAQLVLSCDTTHPGDSPPGADVQMSLRSIPVSPR